MGIATSELQLQSGVQAGYSKRRGLLVTSRSGGNDAEDYFYFFVKKSVPKATTACKIEEAAAVD